MSHTRQEQMEAFGRFLDILDELRVKCPWDRKQTNESLRPNTIEETYELCDALMRDDKKEICKELGDVLLHVAFYAKIGSETGDFDIKDVCDKLCDKLIFRHPHVFGEVKADTAGQVSENWEQLKLKEKDGNKSVLSGVPAALPSLIKAYRIQDKARNVGFDWEEREQVWDKVKEEIGEFQEEVANMDKEKAEAEFGDVMFSLINAARLYKINPDNALELTNQKFIRRFNYLEEHTIKEGKSLKDMRGIVYYGEYLAKTDPLGANVPNPVSHVAYGYATQMCILNKKTGKMEHIVAAHDVGKAVNPLSCEGQIEGGVVMSMGYALREKYPIDENCRPIQKYGSLGLFRAHEVPKIKAIVVDKPGLNVACGAIGIGEITSIPTAPAIADAYFRYDGIRRYSLPLTDTPYERKW